MSVAVEQAERMRLGAEARREVNWKRWGPYLSERQWGTVREDYSADGAAWDYFPFEHAHQRAYRWGEDGLLGVTDRECRLCFALSLWNGKDVILKERLFGLSGPQGNHGEDVKECYFYLDATPTHSYQKALYRYPQAAFPYEQLIQENARRGVEEDEYELLDTGVFDDGRYFDVTAEIAKNAPDDLLVRVTVTNCGPEAARLDVVGNLWFRNTWAWGCRHEGCTGPPWIKKRDDGSLETGHETLEPFRFAAEGLTGAEGTRWLFTNNETNAALFDGDNSGRYTKDAFGRYIIDGDQAVVNPQDIGTKAGAWRRLEIGAGDTAVLRFRLVKADEAPGEFFGAPFEQIFEQRIVEADAFYGELIPFAADDERYQVARQAYAGLLWSKQFYHYVVRDWLEGDPNQPAPPEERQGVRNKDWLHLFNRDVISMPDTWEYPWYAAWDLAFHVVAMAKLDPTFAKQQLRLFLREWYMHPNGQLPAYEWALGDVNPPVHAWACWRVYKISAARGQRDHTFLAGAFQKLLMNFTWWVNRKDRDGNHVFSGGFLGMDNISVFDRSQPLPTGGYLEQADGTAWMAFYCATMLSMAIELAQVDPAYEDMASKFFEHFVAIADAINDLDAEGLWNEEDGFYYDHLRFGPGRGTALKVRSLVGLLPLIAVEVLDTCALEKLAGFNKRLAWFLENRWDLNENMSYMEARVTPDGQCLRRLLAIPTRRQLERVLRRMLDENEFLSPYGVRSLSRHHGEHPYTFEVDGTEHTVRYEPGDSAGALFGGNSNWRGPIWMPINYLLIEALERYHHFYGDDFQIECPTGSGRTMNLHDAAREIGRRLTRLFLADEQGRRPCHGEAEVFTADPRWQRLLLFHEFFHGETGKGLGANHQTGWTALIVRLLEDMIDT